MRKIPISLLCFLFAIGFWGSFSYALERPQEPLHRAAQEGNLSAVKDLVVKGADINALDERIGQSPLHWAAGAGHWDIVKFLVEAGADVNTVSRNGLPVIFSAVYSGSLDILRYFLEHGAKIHVKGMNNETLFQEAITSRKWDIAKYLVSQGIDINARDAQGRSALHLFAGYGQDMGLIDEMLAHGADVNIPTYHGETPLHSAVRHKRDAAVRALLKAGADVNIKDENGFTPLFLAMGGPLSVVQALVEAGAEINIQNKYGWLVFHRIPLKGSMEYAGNACEIIEYLIRHGGDINLADRQGETIIFAAVREGDLDLVKCLVKNGADLNKRRKGETPLDWAVLYRQPDVEKYLREKLK